MDKVYTRDEDGIARPRWRSHRRQDGNAVVEFAVVLPFLALIVLGTVDLGRTFRIQHRLANAAREGGMFAQFHPASVDAGCDGGRNIVDRAQHEDAGLSSLADFRVQVFKRETAGGGLIPADGYRGCRTTAAVTLAPGDRVVVRVSARFTPLTPFASRLVGSTVTLAKSQEVVVQG